MLTFLRQKDKCARGKTVYLPGRGFRRLLDAPLGLGALEHRVIGGQANFQFWLQSFSTARWTLCQISSVERRKERLCAGETGQKKATKRDSSCTSFSNISPNTKIRRSRQMHRFVLFPLSRDTCTK